MMVPCSSSVYLIWRINREKARDSAADVVSWKTDRMSNGRSEGLTSEADGNMAAADDASTLAMTRGNLLGFRLTQGGAYCDWPVRYAVM